MVVVEKGRRFVGERVYVEVTSIVQTNAGKMVFGRFKALSGGASRPAAGPSSEPAEDPIAPNDYENTESNGTGSRDLRESPKGSGSH